MSVHDAIDRLSAAMADRAPRRGLLGWASVITVALIAPAGGLAAGKKSTQNGGKGAGKKPKKPKKSRPHPPPPPPPPSCSGGACQERFVLADNREYCEFICRQCDGEGNDDPRHFCIVDADPSDPDNPMQIAVCCAEGEVCCNGYCCPEGQACCDGNQCCQAGHTCCGDSCCGTDNPWTACCNGQCVATDHHHDHCGACGISCLPNENCVMGQCECTRDCEEECPSGLTRCGFECVNINRHPDHCGGCYNHNPNGLKCCGGNLCTYTDGVCCGGTCYPSYWPSCD